MVYPAEIRYTGFAPDGDPGPNSVVFDYEARPDIRSIYSGFINKDGVGNLDDALLDPLQFISGPGQQHQQEKVHHGADLDLALADPHGLHQDHIVAGGLEKHDGLTCLAGHAAQGAAGG